MRHVIIPLLIAMSTTFHNHELERDGESVIFYCACPHDEGAIQQAKKYQREGFTNVKILEGGVNAWKNAGYGLVAAGT